MGDVGGDLSGLAGKLGDGVLGDGLLTPRANKLGELHVEIRVELVSQDSSMFAQLDADGDGHLNLSELRGAVALLYPAAAWDDTVWVPFCEQYGADPAVGFSMDNFSKLRVVSNPHLILP